MKIDLDFNSLENKIEKLKLKENTKKLFFDKIHKLKIKNPHKYNIYFKSFDMKKLETKLKLSDISLKYLYYKNELKDIIIKMNLRYENDMIVQIRDEELDCILNFEVSYTSDGEYISSIVLLGHLDDIKIDI
ncbi:hypothetical protein WG909_05705 [Peptostreptococcaceae bacterium AGR-M142]